MAKKLLSKKEQNLSPNKTQLIIDYLSAYVKKQEPNSRMPSEHFLMNKFKVSRIIVTQAYKKLENLGMIYALNKKGRFIAENFHNVIKPLSEMIEHDYATIESAAMLIPKWFDDYKILLNEHNCAAYLKKYFHNKLLVMQAEYYVSNKYSIKKLQTDDSVINYLLHDLHAIKNLIYKLRYEKNHSLRYKKECSIVVVYAYAYDDQGICMAVKYIVHPDYFCFEHQQFSLY